MLTQEDVDEIERLTGQLNGQHTEISVLSKRSPIDAVNTFKLKFINTTLESANNLLGDTNKPFKDFNCFNTDDVPSNSDVTFILAQYMQAMEKFRADNIFYESHHWYYRTLGPDKIRTAPPIKIGKG